MCSCEHVPPKPFMWNVECQQKHPALFVWKSANLPCSIQQQKERESVQLFIFFHPVPSQETVSAANGAQQRLDSLVSRTNPHVLWPLTHLYKSTANTAVFSVTLKWSSALSTAQCILKGQISEHKACRWVPWDFYRYFSICMSCSSTIRKFQFMQEFMNLWGCWGICTPLCILDFLHTYMKNMGFLIDFHLISVIYINTYDLHWCLTQFTIMLSGPRTNDRRSMPNKRGNKYELVCNIGHVCFTHSTSWIS